jgi:hypothetical protein
MRSPVIVRDPCWSSTGGTSRTAYRGHPSASCCVSSPGSWYWRILVKESRSCARSMRRTIRRVRVPPLVRHKPLVGGVVPSDEPSRACLWHESGNQDQTGIAKMIENFMTRYALNKSVSQWFLCSYVFVIQNLQC